jgi:hypothetical protein
MGEDEKRAIVLSKPDLLEKPKETVEWKDFVDKLPQDARVKFEAFVKKEGLFTTIEGLISDKAVKTDRKHAFFAELEEEYRRENYCPSLEEIEGMKKDTLMIKTENTLYNLLSDSLDLKKRIHRKEIGVQEVVDIIDLLWESRKTRPGEILVIEREKYGRAQEILANANRGPFTEQEWKEYSRLREANSPGAKKKKLLERDKRKYNEMLVRKFAWERSDDFRKMEQEKEDAEKVLGRFYGNNESIQRDLQISLSEEFARMSGKEAGKVFEEVLMDWMLHSNSRDSIGDEEILLEFDEAIEEWKKRHEGEPAISEVSPELIEKAESLTKHFWDFYVNITCDTEWADEPTSFREAKISQFLVVTKKVTESRKRANLRV